ncbi:hypothetical protein D3C83_34090 [compost metagenome]
MREDNRLVVLAGAAQRMRKRGQALLRGAGPDPGRGFGLLQRRAREQFCLLEIAALQMRRGLVFQELPFRLAGSARAGREQQRQRRCRKSVIRTSQGGIEKNDS